MRTQLQSPHHLLLFCAALSLLWVTAATSSPVLAQDASVHQDIVLVPGEGKQIPIAIPAALLNSKSEGGEIGQGIAKILRRDLEISGIFEVLSPASFSLVSNESLGKTDYDAWYFAKAETVVKTGFTKSNGRLVIDFQLHDAIRKKKISLRYEAPSATPTAYRAAVHAFANAIVKHYTGEEGIFGQRILAVRRVREKGSQVYFIDTDGEGVARVSTKGKINILPTVGPGGGVLYTSYGSNGPKLVRQSGASRTTLISEGVLSRADYCPGNGQIAVTISTKGSAEIYSTNASGSGRRRLTNNRYIDTSPTWSPDCSKIAFVSNRAGSPQIYVMNADGSGVKPLTTSSLSRYNTSPAWSPRGDKIAFSARDERGKFDIFTIEVNGGFLERFTQDQGRNEDPTWSPSGSYLAFVSRRSGGSGIYITPARGGGRIQTRIISGGYTTPSWGF